MGAAVQSVAPGGGESEGSVATSERPWDDPRQWPTPAWYAPDATPQGMIHTYQRFVAHELRTRYMELEGDFRTSVVHDGRVFHPSALGTVRRAFELLQMSRRVLESREPDPLIVAGTLNLIERYMIWFFKAELMPSRVEIMINRLETAKPSGWEWFVKRLRRLDPKSPDEAVALCATMDDAIGLYNQHRLVEHIDNGLQLKRLNSLRTWGLIFMAVFCAASPFATNPEVMEKWPEVPGVSQWLRYGGPWANAVGIMLVGAIGGFLSGLMHVQESRVSLTAYKESVFKLQIKLIVGAIVGLVLFVLLSWKILPGVTIENLGSYFLIAFVSGFSERYFLKILDIERNGEATRAASASALGNAPVPASASAPFTPAPESSAAASGIAPIAGRGLQAPEPSPAGAPSPGRPKV